MAVFSNTELNATIDEKWDQSLMEARYEGGVMPSLVLSKGDMVQKSGDIINLTISARYTVGSVGASDGTFTPQTITPSNVQITVDQWEQCAIEILDKAKWQSFWNPESDFPREAGKLFGERYDDKLMALHTSFTTNDVNSAAEPQIFDDKSMLAQVLKMRNLKIPKEGLSYVLPPEAFYNGILTKPEFRDADKAGLPKSLLSTGFQGKFLGIPVYESALCPSGDIYKIGFLFHTEALALAYQKKSDIKRAEATAAGKFSYIVALQSLYGVKAVRTDHLSRVFVSK